MLVVELLQELDKLDTVVVTGAGNSGQTEAGIQIYPARFLGDGALPNLIVVGATDSNCRHASFTNYADWMTTYAP